MILATVIFSIRAAHRNQNFIVTSLIFLLIVKRLPVTAYRAKDFLLAHSLQMQSDRLRSNHHATSLRLHFFFYLIIFYHIMRVDDSHCASSHSFISFFRFLCIQYMCIEHSFHHVKANVHCRISQVNGITSEQINGLKRGLNNAYTKQLMCDPVATSLKHRKCVRDDEVISNAVFQPPPNIIIV